MTAGDLYPQAYFAYLLVTDAVSAAGIAGVQCGISYASDVHVGVDVFSWTSCATLEFPSADWPASESGNLLTWDASTFCQRGEPGGAGTGVTAVVGYFYCTAYSPDLLRITPRPVDGTAKVVSCSPEENVVESAELIHDPSYLGYAAFSNDSAVSGYSPCGTTSGFAPGCGGGESKPMAQGSSVEDEVLGTIDISSDKYVFLLGTRLVGRVTATYRDGVSYLNGLRWRPPEPAPQDTAPKKRNLERQSLTREQGDFFRRVPFIQERLRSREPLLDAVNRYVRRRTTMIENVSRVYADALRSVGYEAAVERAKLMIDPTIGSRNVGGKDGPIFDPSGDFILAFPGYGTISVSRATDVAAFGAQRTTIPPDGALEDFQELKSYLDLPGPVVAVYSRGGRLLAANEDADTAIAEIEQVLSGASPNAIHAKVLMPAELAEIARAGK